MADAIEEVRAAVERLMKAFSTGDEDGYFDCFRSDATFFFYGQDLIGSREEYRAAVRSWKAEHGFRVLSAKSRDSEIRLFGDTAILTHRVTTIQMWDGEESTLHERESIVFQRQSDGGWLGIHEHLSSDGTS
jgi:uncharacterized protein (TIGR02246 family)